MIIGAKETYWVFAILEMCQMSVNRIKSFAIVRIVHIEQLLGVLGNTGTGNIVNIFSGNKGASD